MFVFSRVQEIKVTFGLDFGRFVFSLQELAGQRGGGDFFWDPNGQQAFQRIWVRYVGVYSIASADWRKESAKRSRVKSGMFRLETAGTWSGGWSVDDQKKGFIRFFDTMPVSDFPCAYMPEFSLRPFPSGPITGRDRSHAGSPGFRAKSLRACPGSLTPWVQSATCDNATPRAAFPIKSQGRQPKRGDFGAR